MKRLIDLLVLIFISVHIYAQEQPELKYNLKKGDEFYYLVDKTETAVKGKLDYYNASSSSSYHVNKRWKNSNEERNRYWLKFKVLGVFGESYKMEMMFTRFRFMKGDYVYDSDSTQKVIDYGIRVKQYLIGESITFYMNKYGDLGEFKISDEYYSNVFSHDDSKGLMKKIEIRNYSIIGYENLNEIVKLVFSPLAENKTTNWNKRISYNCVFPAIETQYKKCTTDDLVKIEVMSDYFNENKVRYKITGGYYTPLKFKIKGEYRYDENNMCNSSEFSGRYILDHIGHNEIVFTLKLTKYNPDDNVKNIIIKGQISKKTGIKRLHLFDASFFFKNNIRKTANIDRDGNFEFRIKSTRPAEFSLSDGKYLKFRENVIAEPGDSIFINIDSDFEFSFNGTGGKKNILYRDLMKKVSTIDNLDTPDNVLNIINQNRNKIFGELNINENRGLSKWAKDCIKTNIYYKGLFKISWYYTNNKDSNNYKYLFKKLFNKVDFQKYSTIEAAYFSNFLNHFMYKKVKNQYADTKNMDYSPKEMFFIAKMLFTGEVRYRVMANYLLGELGSNRSGDFKSMYIEFIKDYPGTLEAKKAKLLYRQKKKLTIGEKVADILLKNENGDIISTNYFKNKWLFLMYVNVEFNDTKKIIKGLENMTQRFPSEWFKPLIICDKNLYSKTKKFLEKNDINIEVLMNLDYEDDIQNKLNIDISSLRKTIVIKDALYTVKWMYLINPDGELEHQMYANSLNYISDKIEYYINNDLKNRKNKDITFSRTEILNYVFIFLIIIILIWRGLRWRTLIIQRREINKREKLELQMQAVRSQLNPHFLFNSMSSIQYLVNANENEKANNFLSKFANLMRRVLNQSQSDMRPLADEMQTITTYLELEALRHNFRFKIDTDKDVDIHTVEIPEMLLQPFVENAVVHGINGMEGGEINIKLTKRGNSIVISISDNGAGLKSENKCSNKSNGKGLELIRKRIELMIEKYKNDINFRLIDRADIQPGETGTIARISFELEA